MKSEISKGTCLILASVCAAIWSFDCAGTNWQGFSPQEAALRLIPVHGFRDPGGVVYYPDRGTLFLVGDHGDIAELRADGKILRRKHCGGDLEGIAYDPRTGLLYLAVEGVDEIWECDPGNFEVKRRFKIDRAYRGDSDFLKAGGQGIEGIAFIPDSRHPEGGTFFIVNQMDPPALVEVEVPLRSAEGRGVSKAKIVDFYDLGYPDLSGLYYDGKRNELYVLSNEWNVLLVVNRSGKIVRKMPMPGYYDQEGITFDADGNIFFAQDAGGLTKVDFTYTLEQWQTVRRRSFSPLFVEIRRGPPFTQEAHIRVKNPLSSPGSGTINWNIRAQGVQIAPERYEYSVQPQGDIRVPFKVTFKEGTDLRYPLADYEATFIKAGTQTPIFITGKMRFTPSLVCRKRVRPISIDGDLQDWVRFKPLYLNRKEQVRFGEAFQWGGPEDLSGEVLTCWDEDYFYFAAVVKDNRFYQTFSDRYFWRGDSVQLALDTLNEKSGWYDANDYEYGLALTPEGEKAWRMFEAGAREPREIRDVKLSISLHPKKGECIYEAAVPWSELSPLEPKEGVSCGFNVIINDNDGEERKGWIEWTPGIGREKDTSYFGDLLFEATQ